jgi:hypothetical protein
MSEMYLRFAFLAEQERNIGNAEHVRAHDRAVFARRPLPDIPPHLLSPEKLQQTRTVTEASAVTRMDATAQTSLFGEYWMRARLADLQLPRQRPHDHTVRLDMRSKYDRPNQVDDAVLLDEDWEIAHIPAPTTTINLTELRDAYVDEVARMWSIPILDMTGGRRGSASGGTMSTILVDERRDVIKRERRACANLIAFFYQHSLAAVDLLHLSHALETFDAEMMERVARTIGERRALLKETLGGKEKKKKKTEKKRKRTDTETSSDEGLPAGKRSRLDAGATTATATLGELKQTIREQVLEQQSLEAHLIFATDLMHEEEKSKWTDQDELDPEIRKARLQEARVLLTAAQLGVASNESVRRALQELLGVKLGAASASQLQLPPPPKKKSKQKPRSAATGGKNA